MVFGFSCSLSGGGYRVCLLDNEGGPAPSCMRYTGDRGWVSRDGHVYFAGRLDRQIKRHGHRLNLDFIEEVGTMYVYKYPYPQTVPSTMLYTDPCI